MNKNDPNPDWKPGNNDEPTRKKCLECAQFFCGKKNTTFWFMTYFCQSILRLHSFTRQTKGIKRLTMTDIALNTPKGRRRQQ